MKQFDEGRGSSSVARYTQYTQNRDNIRRERERDDKQRAQKITIYRAYVIELHIRENIEIFVYTFFCVHSCIRT